MARLREVSRAEATDPVVLAMYDRLFGDRDPVAQRGTATGTPGDWWTVFALVPDVFRHAVDGFALYRSRAVDPVLRELAQTRAGWLKSSKFVYSQHCKALRGLGVDEDRIRSVKAWAVASCFDERERTVLAYTDELVQGGGRVTDETFEALQRHLPDEQILELTYITCLYDMHAVMTRALRLEFDDREDPIVEDMPSGERVGLDLGRAISHET